MTEPLTPRSFLPAARRGLGAALPTPDTLGAGVPARAGVPLELRVSAGGRPAAGSPLRMPLRLHGPGDVTGLEPDQIARTDPRAGTTDFEPNLLAQVELRADLPWLFTPARADARGRVRPWLVLVVVESRRAEIGAEPGGPLPVLTVPRSELPDLSESWAWAHVQESPAGTVARLLCPRRLRPQTSYLACVVPAFAAGVRAGLGAPADDGALAPAWTAGGEGVERLPVYHHWTFATGAGGDFESLVRRLEPRRLPPAVGSLALDLGAPGGGVAARSRATLALAGALRVPKQPAEREEDVPAELRDALRAALAAGGVAPPLYGEWYARAAALAPDGAAGGWLRDANLDPRSRVAAGLGTLVVRYEQERLMAEAWEQLAAHEETQAAVTRTQLAEEVDAALARRLPDRLGRPGDPRPAPPATTDPTETPRFAPSFEQPMYEALRDWFDGMLLPGLSEIPPNSIALLETNPRFIEAFMLGLNHELSRELVWRGYPTDRRGTYFRRFWDAPATAGSQPLPDVRGWPAASRLGEHLGGDEGRLVLVIRGDVLARCPRAVVYAAEAARTPAGARVPGAARRLPAFRGSAGTDVTFLGFELTEADARGSAAHPGWFFVLEEPAAEARFGFDEPPAGDGAPRPPGALAAWSDATWADVGTAPGSHVTLAGRLAGLRLAERAGSGPAATWGENSAHMAVIAQQRPFRIAVHASAWLPVRGPIAS